MYFDLQILTNEYIISNWSEINLVLHKSFENKTFNDGFDIERPKNYTLREINKEDNKGLRHILVFNNEAEIIGGLFCIPQKKMDKKDYCDLGWFFTSSNLTVKNRLLVADEIMKTAHKMIKNIGITKVITEMGTKEGEKLMCKKYGYYHSPLGNQTNRWTKEL